MNSSPRDAYLVAQVMTAPPQKLHLMLVEGAIRLAQRAQRHWAAKEDDRAAEALGRAQEIVGQLLAGFRRDVDEALVKRIAGIYLFVYRALMDASLRRDETRLADALKVLDAERETWRQLCERLGAAQPENRYDTPMAPGSAGGMPHLWTAAQPGPCSFEA
jgi:flagellar protein FliS